MFKSKSKVTRLCRALGVEYIEATNDGQYTITFFLPDRERQWSCPCDEVDDFFDEMVKGYEEATSLDPVVALVAERIVSLYDENERLKMQLEEVGRQ